MVKINYLIFGLELLFLVSFVSATTYTENFDTEPANMLFTGTGNSYNADRYINFNMQRDGNNYYAWTPLPVNLSLYNDDFIDVWNSKKWKELRSKLTELNGHVGEKTLEETLKNVDKTKPFWYCDICLARWGRCF